MALGGCASVGAEADAHDIRGGAGRTEDRLMAGRAMDALQTAPVQTAWTDERRRNLQGALEEILKSKPYGTPGVAERKAKTKEDVKHFLRDVIGVYKKTRKARARAREAKPPAPPPPPAALTAMPASARDKGRSIGALFLEPWTAPLAHAPTLSSMATGNGAPEKSNSATVFAAACQPRESYATDADYAPPQDIDLDALDLEELAFLAVDDGGGAGDEKSCVLPR